MGVVLLVDVSGSMGWRYGSHGLPAQITQDLLLSVIETFDIHDRVGIASFSRSAQLVLPFVEGSEHARLNSAIQSLEAGGSTNMEAGLILTRTMFQQAEMDVEQKRVLLITDAQPNVGATSPSSFMELAQDLAQEGIGLTVIGSGLGLNPDIFSAMVNLEGGNAFSITDAEQVPEFIDQNWPMLLCPLAYELSVEITPPARYTVGQEYGFPGEETRLQVASVFLSRRRGALLVRLDGGLFEELTAELGLSYRTVDGEQVNETLSLDLPPGASPDEEGRYFSHVSTQISTALALMITGAHDAAEIYQENHEASVELMSTVVSQFRSDVQALSGSSPGDLEDLRRELDFVVDMLALMESHARQGTLYGGF